MNQREKTSLKNMEYNRYIALRYSLAVLFFANLNWLVFLLTVRSVYVLLPFVMLVFAGPSIMEQIKVYGQKSSLTYTTRYFKSQLLLNGLLCVLAFVPVFFRGAFPFMAESAQGLIGLQIVLVLGIGTVFDGSARKSFTDENCPRHHGCRDSDHSVYDCRIDVFSIQRAAVDVSVFGRLF
ncbi:hypothetical protein [Atopococcus tabaci]|uniref:hypothetical protein n=1 Tax=Atopococcus tabaci TaxID=269774 RepID=UPI00240A3AAA|nr:hypothetical protein [Atopococcus tabaci]